MGCLHARGTGGEGRVGLKLGEASAGRDGDGGESVESQEGEFGAEVSAFLSGAACVWVSVYVYPRSRARRFS